MHAVYKAVPLADIQRIIDYCRDHMKNNGDLFEVYPGQEDHMAMVIVNACSGEYSALRPVGAFYCNFVGPGVISIEEEDPSFDGAESRTDRKSTRLNSSHTDISRMPSSA